MQKCSHRVRNIFEMSFIYKNVEKFPLTFHFPRRKITLI